MSWFLNENFHYGYHDMYQSVLYSVIEYLWCEEELCKDDCISTVHLYSIPPFERPTEVHWNGCLSNKGGFIWGEHLVLLIINTVLITIGLKWLMVSQEGGLLQQGPLTLVVTELHQIVYFFHQEQSSNPLELRREQLWPGARLSLLHLLHLREILCACVPKLLQF